MGQETWSTWRNKSIISRKTVIKLDHQHNHPELWIWIHSKRMSQSSSNPSSPHEGIKRKQMNKSPGSGGQHPPPPCKHLNYRRATESIIDSRHRRQIHDHDFNISPNGHHQHHNNHHLPVAPAGSHYLQNIPGINMTLAANDPNIRTIKQHYYPEGGWGWIVVGVVCFTHFITSGVIPAGGLLLIEIMKTFNPDQGVVAAGM